MCWPVCKKCGKKIPKYIFRKKQDYKCVKCGEIWKYPHSLPKLLNSDKIDKSDKISGNG